MLTDVNYSQVAAMRAAQDEARKKMSDFAKEGRQQLREIEREMKDPRERARERDRERERSVLTLEFAAVF